MDFGGARMPGGGGQERDSRPCRKRTKRAARPEPRKTRRLRRMRRRTARRIVAAAILFGVPVGAAATTDGRSGSAPLVVEVRVFEIRRLNSDFSPIEDLSFLVDTDGSSVQVSEWLATLARRVPDAYFAQLLTFGPTPAESEAEWQITRRDPRRAIRLRMDFSRPEPHLPESGAPEPRFRLDFDLLRMGTAAQRDPGGRSGRGGHDPDGERPRLRNCR